MPEPTIYNCHVHIFTRRHVPIYFLRLLFDDTRIGRWLGPTLSGWLGERLSDLARIDWLARLLTPLARWLARATDNDIWEREARFLDTGDKACQVEIFDVIAGQYPQKTLFIVLPMDMAHARLGDVPASIDAQHEELLALANSEQSRAKIIPFFAADPRRPDLLEQVRKNLTPDRFRGLKIYPNLGYAPDCEQLMEVYAICQERNVPVMTHCSTGGVWQFGLCEADRIALSHPHRYIPILEKFPKLRICLAHFGGSPEWLKHLSDTSTKQEQQAGDAAWVKVIGDMIRGGKYENLYTDISYTAFAPRFGTLYFDFFDYLKVLLVNQELREHVLFGSDFYMVVRERLTEREVSIALRSRLGEELYFQIANVNPRLYLYGDLAHDGLDYGDPDNGGLDDDAINKLDPKKPDPKR